jgi:hypothetical protein
MVEVLCSPPGQCAGDTRAALTEPGFEAEQEVEGGNAPHGRSGDFRVIAAKQDWLDPGEWTGDEAASE